ncbi:HinT-interacting membrane complex protein P80 [Mycoplasma sp. 'Moose RK']|uniref:HinT-interacting membrane complex protein P80 n=1 Tax=Mycoplasma sp. 'Moose RK' TaxID=2780095 RepID=UPI0018C26DD9|nr:hypothetical protein [Mycoplasma sp. 'Moose RK']MBG0730692.1 hypothetical protein [Mycoplasma sp. 'Moose RK']
MKKQNIFQKIANLNSENKQKNEQKPAKSKTKKILLTSLGIGGFSLTLGLGIGIPLYFSSQKNNLLNKRNPNDDAVIFKSPKSTKNLKISDVLAIFNSTNAKQRENLLKAQKNLIEFLYNQEYYASKVFQSAWENTNSEKTTGNSRKFSLQSFSEIRESQKKYLEDERSRYQRTFGFNNWESEFNKYLNSDPRFNSAINFDQAVDALTISNAREIAFSRFKLEFNKNFTKSDIEDRILKDDIKDEKGIVVFKKGDKLFKGLIELGKNAFVPDISAPKSGKDLEIKDQKVAAFLSQSYIKDYMNPEKIIKQIYFDASAPLRGNFNFYKISQISINAKPNDKDAKAPWILTKETLEQLLAYKILVADSTSSTAKNVSNNLELIEKFQGGNSTDPVQNRQDKILLSTLIYEKNKENASKFGELPVVSLNQLLNNNEASYVFAFMPNLFANNQKTNLFSKILFEKLKTSVFKDAPSILVAPSSLNSKSISEISALNQRLKSFINGLSENQIKEAGKAFLETFAASANDTRIKSVYEIGNNLKVISDSKGLKVLATTKISSIEQFNEIIKKQLQLNANNQLDPKQNSTINLSELFADISNNDFIQALLIDDPEYQKQLKTASEQEQSDFLSSVAQAAKNYLNFYILDQVLRINGKLQDYITNATLNNLNADFHYNNAAERWELAGNPNKELRQAIIDKLESLFQFRR